MNRTVEFAQSPRYSRAAACMALFGLASFIVPSALAESPAEAYPAASRAPSSVSGWDQYALEPEPSAPLDEAKGAVTLRGTPISKRGPFCFPSETRNLFSKLDRRPGPDGAKSIFDPQDVRQSASPGEARQAIRGQNTWMLWGQGDEAFWGWFQENGYGIGDFLILIDSRKRDRRFHDLGLVNQPGMQMQSDPAKKILGLYIDQAKGDAITLTQDDNDKDAGKMASRLRPPPQHATELFKPGDRELFERTLSLLPNDGVDPTVYGYPSGIVGLRLMPNPDFFGNTPQAKQARDYWRLRVIEHDDAYYTDPAVHADPNLVRPFRVSMSCAFCHVGPHPLYPPSNPEAPEWENLSSTIGSQYFQPATIVTNLKKSDSFLYQFLASQPAGTIDTSMIATDQINNPVVMNALFDVPARLERAQNNRMEEQSAANLLAPAIEANPTPRERHTPRVLMDGADSIGIRAALARVYLNIGAYYEQWNRLHNPLIGAKPQRPFTLATLQDKSIYWQASGRDKEAVSQIASFLTYKNERGDSVTAPMKLADADDPKAKASLASTDFRADARKGRAVFLNHCAICHSSKQPQKLQLSFSCDWAKQGEESASAYQASKAAGTSICPAEKQAANIAKENSDYTLILPMDYKDWEDFKSRPPYQEYMRRMVALAGNVSDDGKDPFLKDNFLSTDIRIPVTLVGTNSARAVGTNGMRGQVWDNFSSETYKNLEAVGEVHFYNPYSSKTVDPYGNNDTYAPPGGGPGYYRPLSLIGIWATGPYLHNNALGTYNQDPSVQGRLDVFDHSIDLLFKSQRDRNATPSNRLGDLRSIHKELAGNDQGFIYRTTARSWFDIPHRFIRPFVAGLIGERWLSFLTFYLWLLLGLLALVLAVWGRSRHAGIVLVFAAIVLGVTLRYTRIDSIYPALWWWPLIAGVVGLILIRGPQIRTVAVIFFSALLMLSFVGAIQTRAFVDGERGDLRIGPFPMGTPVNLIMNLNPEAPIVTLLDAAAAMVRGFLRINKDNLLDADGAALRAFEEEAGMALMRASKCPDFVLDRGHWFAESLSEDEKQQLKAFLKTL